MSFALKNACSVLRHFVPMGLKTCQNVPNTYISFAFVKNHEGSSFVPFRVISCQRLLRGHENVPKRATRGVHSISLDFDFYEAFLAQHVCFPVLITRFLPMAPASAEAKLMALKGKFKGKGKDVKGAIADILKGKGFGNGGLKGKGVGGKEMEPPKDPPKEVEPPKDPPKEVEPPKDPPKEVEPPKHPPKEVEPAKDPPKEVKEAKKVPPESRFDSIYTIYTIYIRLVFLMCGHVGFECVFLLHVSPMSITCLLRK